VPLLCAAWNKSGSAKRRLILEARPGKAESLHGPCSRHAASILTWSIRQARSVAPGLAQRRCRAGTTCTRGRSSGRSSGRPPGRLAKPATCHPAGRRRKGEEISYFQFGGSDIVVLFEARSNVSFTAQPNVHYKMGTRIAQAFPVLG
jgi:hypothetical protein